MNILATVAVALASIYLYLRWWGSGVEIAEHMNPDIGYYYDYYDLDGDIVVWFQDDDTGHWSYVCGRCGQEISLPVAWNINTPSPELPKEILEHKEINGEPCQ